MCIHRVLRITIALFAALAGIAQATSPVPRIIGGNNAGNGEYPFMAALVDPAVTSSDRNATFCGGSIIATRWILTAGHCVTDSSGGVIATNEIAVIAGVTTLDAVSASATRIPVDAIVRHPDFNKFTLNNDMALLHLGADVVPDANLSLDDESIVGVLVSGDDLTTIGWGVTDQSPETFPLTLQEVVLDYIPYNTCNNASHYYATLPGSVICAGFLADPPRDSCIGDSGGPLLRALGGGAWSQVGITSFGDESGCATARFPGVYARVGLFHSFIDDRLTKPDLLSSIAALNGTQSTTGVTSRITLANLSPGVTATGVTLTVTLAGGATFGDNSALGNCTQGVTLDCTFPDLAPNASTSIDVLIVFPGNGTYKATVAAQAANGDYDPDNNSRFQRYRIGSGSSSGGGGMPVVAIVALFLLLLRRR